MTDEMLNYYGDLFVQLRFQSLAGMTFEEFLTRPDFYINAATALTTAGTA